MTRDALPGQATGLGAGGLGATGGASRPERPIEADWLALRRDMDDAAREAAQPLCAELAAWHRARVPVDVPADAPVEVFDLGSGTGANQAYLSRRLPFPTRWTLLDHDPALLSHPGQGPGRRVLAGVEELPGLLEASSRERPGVAQVVTCSALLDLLAADDLDGLAATLHAAGAPGLFALTVTGSVEIDPPERADETVRRCFDAHMAREGRPGPGAGPYLAEAARTLGARVVDVPTPWRIDTGDPATRAFARRWLTDRAAAAVEQDAAERPAVHEWLVRRLRQVDGGTLKARVGHVDLLVLP